MLCNKSLQDFSGLAQPWFILLMNLHFGQGPAGIFLFHVVSLGQLKGWGLELSKASSLMCLVVDAQCQMATLHVACLGFLAANWSPK